MTDAMPDEPGGGPDDPDFVDPLTAEDIIARAGHRAPPMPSPPRRREDATAAPSHRITSGAGR